MLISIISALFISTLSGPPDTTALRFSKEIKASDMEAFLKKLAGREFEGRETGKKGQKLAASYIANIFKQNGLTGIVSDTGYFQQYPLTVQNPAGIELKIAKKKFAFLKDFYFFPGFSDVDINTDSIVFAGYGIDAPNYSDYRKCNCAGKVLVILDGEPVDKDSNSVITGTKETSEWSNSWRLKSEAGLKNQAKAVLIISANFEKKLAGSRHFIENPNVKLDIPKESKPSIPFIYISPQLGEKLLGKKVPELKSITKKTDSSAVYISKRKFRLSIQRPVERIFAENVLGFIPGTSKKDEVLVISAHYDHLGKKDTTIYYGADDDGSGTTALLSLAKAFAKASSMGFRPKRSILFLAVSGEEKGLLGSEYYSENPVIPLKNTVVDLNIDMIGRRDKKHINTPDYIYLIGSDKLSTELHQISEATNSTYTNLELDYTYNNVNDPNRYYYRSDHYNFAKHNIPVIFYFNGVHEDYHKPTDTVDKIEFAKMEKITRLVFLTAWEIANRDARITIDKKPN
jgi:hypothetical protein